MGYVARMGGFGKAGKMLVGSNRRRWQKVDFKEMVCEIVDWVLRTSCGLL